MTEGDKIKNINEISVEGDIVKVLVFFQPRESDIQLLPRTYDLEDLKKWAPEEAEKVIKQIRLNDEKEKLTLWYWF